MTHPDEETAMARRQSPRNVITNWRDSDLPLPKRFLVLVKNNAKKAATLSTCCGNPGEPGC